MKPLKQFTKSIRYEYAKEKLLEAKPKRVCLSGPSGFLGSRVFEHTLQIHELRRQYGLETGEIILLSSSPGRLMSKLYTTYGSKLMETVRASRVDYYTQHDERVWRDHLGSLNLEGENSVFINLAGIAGPIPGKPQAMMAVNYHAPIAAANACLQLGFGHFIQSSTQATNAERAGQVPYSRAKAMCDFHISRLPGLTVTIACLGLLYCKTDGIVGQSRSTGKINLIDLALLPLTPILGDGSAPLQPQEIRDAAERLTFLGLTETNERRPSSYRSHIKYDHTPNEQSKLFPPVQTTRFYDAVGPDTISILNMQKKFAKYLGNSNFRPVFIDYRNMEELLNIKSLGNLNRQFVSLLRSEQDSASPIIGNPLCWERLLGPEIKLTTLDSAFLGKSNNQSSELGQQVDEIAQAQRSSLKEETTTIIQSQSFPFMYCLSLIKSNPRLILPGLQLTREILSSYFSQIRNGKS